MALRSDTEGWLDTLVGQAHERPRPAPLIGTIAGEGVGPEVVAAALSVLEGLEGAGGETVVIEELGGPVGHEAERELGVALPEDVTPFCEDVFGRGGAILNGPGGGRYVYDLRRRLSLFLKLNPIDGRNGLAGASSLRPEWPESIDLLLVRENLGGVYQGETIERETVDTHGLDRPRVVRHCFSCVAADVQRFLDAAARLASSRRGALTVVIKQAGLPVLSDLWRACALEASDACGVRCSFVDIDLMAYQLVTQPGEFDVIAAPNMCGDILGDLAGVLVGSRALLFSGNFSPRGEAVYQTNHGAAYDIAGGDRANPVGQILSLAMLLRESLGLRAEACAIEDGVRRVWAAGWRTADVARGGGRVVGTSEMAELVAVAAADAFTVALETP